MTGESNQAESMRRIINVTNISLDGVMERMEDWHFP